MSKLFFNGSFLKRRIATSSKKAVKTYMLAQQPVRLNQPLQVRAAYQSSNMLKLYTGARDRVIHLFIRASGGEVFTSLREGHTCCRPLQRKHIHTEH